MSDHVESDGLGERTALSNGDNITLLDFESRGAVCGNVLVTLLETTVLLDVVQVIPSDDDCALHLGGDDHSRQNASSNGDVACEGALFVDVVVFDGLVGGLDSQTDISHKAHGLLAFIANGTLAGHKDGILLLVGLLVL